MNETKIQNQEEFFLPPEISSLLKDEHLFGRMNDATASSFLTGACGDAMEFYLVIENKRITQIKYYTDGCGTTKACAAIAASLAEGKTIEEALHISAGEIIGRIKGLPHNHLHCSILAVSTLYRALADYLLQK